MHISWSTLALQVVNFVVLAWLLQRFLYKPVRDILEKRKALAKQALDAAEMAKTEAEAERKRYEDERAALVEERREMLEAAHHTIEAERKERLDEAREEGKKLVAVAHQSIVEERAKTLHAMETDIAGVAVNLASKLLEKLGGAISSDIFLDRTQAALKELPDAERRRLERDLTTNSAPVRVVTASRLTADEQKKWQAQLESDLEGPLNLTFDTDPELIAGAAIHFPHVVVSFAWSDQLKEAKQALLSGNHDKPS